MVAGEGTDTLEGVVTAGVLEEVAVEAGIELSVVEPIPYSLAARAVASRYTIRTAGTPPRCWPSLKPASPASWSSGASLCPAAAARLEDVRISKMEVLLPLSHVAPLKASVVRKTMQERKRKKVQSMELRSRAAIHSA